MSAFPNPPFNGPLPAEALRVLDVLGRVIPGRTVGAYLYGSVLVGGLRPQSDVDVMVIVDAPLVDAQRRTLVDELLKISGRAAVAGPSRPLEVTFAAINEVVPWRFPPVRDLVFGEWLREGFEAGRIAPPGPNPDLAILVSQLLRRSHLLAGASAERLLAPVPARDLRRALALTLPDTVAATVGDGRNAILTLARMWFTAATGEIAAKDAAADWVMPLLPKPLAMVLALARAGYLGEVRDDWEGRGAQVREFAECAAGEIMALLAHRKFEAGR